MEVRYGFCRLRTDRLSKLVDCQPEKYQEVNGTRIISTGDYRRVMKARKVYRGLGTAIIKGCQME